MKLAGKSVVGSILTLALFLAPVVSARNLYWADASGYLWRSSLSGSNARVFVSGLGEPTGVAVDPRHQRIYWADPSRGVIQRARLDGSAIETVVSQGQPLWLELDLDGRKLYWTQRESREIWRANLDGSNPGKVLLAPRDPHFSRDGIRGLALDLPRDRIYWINRNSLQVERSHPDGAELENLMDLRAWGWRATTDIDLFKPSNFAYWSDASHGVGGMIIQSSFASPFFGRGQREAIGVAVDDAGDNVYFTGGQFVAVIERQASSQDVARILTSRVGMQPRGIAIGPNPGLSFCGDGQVGSGETCDPGSGESGTGCRADCSFCGDGVVDGGEECDPGNVGTSEVCRDDCTRCGDRFPGPDGRCGPRDPMRASLYWADRQGRIWTAAANGRRPSILAELGGRPRGLAVDAAGRKVYWAEPQRRRVGRMNLDGTAAEYVIESGHPSWLAIDPVGRRLYWTEQDSRMLRRARLDGTEIESLFEVSLHDSYPEGLALDLERGWIYTAQRRPDEIRNEGLIRTRADGARTEQVADFRFNEFRRHEWPLDIAVDGEADRIYWTDTAYGVTRKPATSSSFEPVMTDVAGHGIALDLVGGRIYWTGGGAVYTALLDGSGFLRIVHDPEMSAYGIALGPASTVSECGNGTLDPDEECDDGNDLDGDGCSSNCTIEPACPLVVAKYCDILELEPAAIRPSDTGVRGGQVTLHEMIETRWPPRSRQDRRFLDRGDDDDDDDDDDLTNRCFVDDTRSGGAGVHYLYVISNVGDRALRGLRVHDDRLGAVPGSPLAGLEPGRTVTLEATTVLEGTTHNIVSVSAGFEDGGNCVPVTAEATVTFVHATVPRMNQPN